MVRIEQPEYCPSRAAIDMIADKWTVLVVCALIGHVRRYNELHRLVGNISQKVLTDTLRKLERDGLVQRTVYPVVPPKVEYQLTELGETLVPLIMDLFKWADVHMEKVEQARGGYLAVKQSLTSSPSVTSR
jgi:DNA-binding HxlR family transcriptional regulator